MAPRETIFAANPEKRPALVRSPFILRNGAEGEARTPTGFLTSPVQAPPSIVPMGQAGGIWQDSKLLYASNPPQCPASPPHSSLSRWSRPHPLRKYRHSTGLFL